MNKDQQAVSPSHPAGFPVPTMAAAMKIIKDQRHLIAELKDELRKERTTRITLQAMQDDNLRYINSLEGQMEQHGF